MRKSVTSVVAVGLIGAAAYLFSAGGPQAGSSDTFRQLKLFGDVSSASARDTSKRSQ
jgi:hypothetical protein